MISLGRLWTGFEGFPDACQTDVHHYRRQKVFSASHRAMLGYKKSLLFVQGHMLV